MKFGLENKDLEWMCKIFSQFPDIDSVIVFGSRSMGNFKKGSDVDLVLIGNINPSIVNRVKFLLNEEIPLPYFFDVVVYQEIESKELKSHIAQYGKTFYKKKL